MRPHSQGSWKPLQFFRKSVVTAPPTGRRTTADPVLRAVQGIQPSCSTASRDHAIIGDKQGFIHVFPKNFLSRTYSFQAFKHRTLFVFHTHDCADRSLDDVLVAVGLDSAGLDKGVASSSDRRALALRVYHLGKSGPKGTCLCLRTHHPFVALPSDVEVLRPSCFSATRDLTQAAFGLDNGTVLLLDGLLIQQNIVYARNQSSPLPNGEAAIRACLVHMDGGESGPSGVSNILFREREPHSLYVVTEQQVSTVFTRRSGYRASSQNSFPWVSELADDVGCTEKLSATVDPRSGHLYAVADDILWMFDFNTRLGGGVRMAGQKQCVLWFGEYLCVVTTSRNGDMVALYDKKHSFLGFRGYFDSVTQLFAAFGRLYILEQVSARRGGSESKESQPQTLVHALQEISFAEKVQTLVKTSNFELAVTLAEEGRKDPAFMAQIRRMHGDHAHDRGDYEKAIACYQNTIGYIPPSYVIRRFIDPQHVRHLTAYLEALHQQRRTTKEHITLLLTCYVRLDQDEELARFFRRQLAQDGVSDQEDRGGDAPIPSFFDLGAAVRLLVRAKKHSFALMLAQRYRRYRLYVELLTSPEVRQYREAIRCVEQLPPTQAVAVLHSQGIGLLLMQHEPTRMVALLLHLCTARGVTGTAVPAARQASSGPSERKKTGRSSAAPLVISTTDSNVYDPLGMEDNSGLPELVIEKTPATVPTGAVSSTAGSTSSSSSATTTTSRGVFANPLEFFDLFAGMDQHFYTLLAVLSVVHQLSTHIWETPSAVKWPVLDARGRMQESTDSTNQEFNADTEDQQHVSYSGLARHIVARRWQESQCTVPDWANDSEVVSVLYENLLELCLKYPDGRIDDPQSGARQQGDQNNACTALVMALLTNPQYFPLDRSRALVVCRQYGFSAGTLHLLEQLEKYRDIVMEHVQRDDDDGVMRACTKYGEQDPSLWQLALRYFASKPTSVDAYLERILARLSEAPPLMLVRVLASNPRMAVGQVVRRHLVSVFEKKERTLREEHRVIGKLRQDTEEMQARMEAALHQPVTFTARRCHFCAQRLSLPAVHFLCNHSFHARHLDESEGQCPLCAEQNERVQGGIRQPVTADKFHSRLDEEGFPMLVEYLGQGVVQSLRESQDRSRPEKKAQ